MEYSFSREVSIDYDEAVVRVKDELKKEGFGVLTEIDVKAVLKNKLNVNFNKYVILGACNPPYAYKSLQIQKDIGILLPCNVIVYENDEKQVIVSAINPRIMLSIIPNPELDEISTQIAEKLKKVVNNI
ncbi:MAG: DUF302 domain-containing protein [Promethearchaeota archaeon]